MGANTGVLKALDSMIRSRLDFMNRIGKTFGGRRDLYDTLGYPRTIKFDDFFERYLRGGIGGKVVDALPQATWRNRPKIISNDESFNEAWGRLADRLSIFHYLERADRISGIGHYGVLFIGARAGSDESPIQEVRDEGDILFLSPFSEGRADIERLVDDTRDPRFNLPQLYTLYPGQATDGTIVSHQSIRVHHSRVIHIAEGLVEDEIFGIPRMQRVWNYLLDLDKVVGGSSEAVWRTVDRGIQFNVDKDAELSEDQEKQFSEEIEEYIHGLRRHLRTQGVEANVLGSDVNDPTGQFDMLMSLISGTTGIPKRTLLGAESGQLASNQDERNFNALVKARQESYAEPLILRPLIDKFMDIGALPKTDYQVHWPDLSTLTRREQADVAARYAQALANFSKQEGVDRPVLQPEEFRDKFLRTDPPRLAEGPEDPVGPTDDGSS